MLKQFQNKESRNFFRNAFLNMNYKVETTFTQEINEEKYKQQFSEISKLINKDKLNVVNERDVFHVMKIIMAITFQNLIQNFAKELSYESALEMYILEINLIKKGLCKG